MAAVHRTQQPVVEGLYAETYAVDGRIAQRGDIVVGHVVGVDLDGNLLRRRTVPQHRRSIDQPLQPLRRAERRGTAAEIYSADSRVAAEIVAPPLHFAPHGIERGGQRRERGRAEKVAIGANAFAVGNMQV